MRLEFVEQFYFPEGWGGAQLPRDITIGLARFGYRVEVLCGSDQYAPTDGDDSLDPAKVGVTIRRIPKLFAGDIHRLKLFRQMWFYLAAVPQLALRRAPALYIAQTNPPMMIVIVTLIAAFKSRPVIVIAQDVYPEILFAHGMLSEKGAIGGLMTTVFRWAYRRAKIVVSLGPKMTRRLIQKGVEPGRVVEISNWATGDTAIVRGELNRLREDWGLRGKFVLLYSGNLGIAHEIQTLIRAVGLMVREVPNIQLVFVGKGSRLEEARRLTEDLHLESFVSFKKAVPLDLLPHSLGLADLAVVTLKPGFEGLVVPSKLLGHMAREVPTLYVGPADSDVAVILGMSGGGVCFLNGADAALAQSIGQLSRDKSRLKILGSSAKKYYEEHFAISIGIPRYCELVKRVLG